MKKRSLVQSGLTPVLTICMVLTSMAQEWVGTRPRVIPWSRDGVADRLRLGVRTEGFHCVAASEVATAMGAGEDVVLNAFQATNLTLSCQGQNIPCSVMDGQLYFKGESAHLQRAPENVYWLRLNTGDTPLPLLPDPPASNNWVMVETSIQGTTDGTYCSMGTLTNLPSYLAFKLIEGGKSHTVTNRWEDGVTNVIPGEVSVTLLSAASFETFPHTHSARVLVNGTPVGVAEWEDERYETFTYSVPGELLTNGLAVVCVTNLLSSNTNDTRFFWTKVAFNIAKQANHPPVVRYPSLRGVRDADGTAADNVADYVVLIPPEGWVLGFRETLQPLVEFRARQGLRPAVIDVEALYNRFTQGMPNPEAIRAFCSNAFASASVKLKYLLIAGSGSLDFAHEKFAVTNYQACLIPPLIDRMSFPITKEAMIVPIDQAFGDVTGNAAPEIAVGRYPTAWTQELAVAVAKALAYEASLPWKRRVAVSAASGFTNDMNIVKVPLEAAGKAVTDYYPATPTVWNNALKAAFQNGLGSFWYLGHSHTSYFGEKANLKLMSTALLKTTSWLNHPIAVLMGCHLNNWQAMNVTKPDAASFGPFSVFRSGTGFSAVFASTGYAWDGELGDLGEAQRLALYLSECSGTNGIYRIGDAICEAEQRLALYDPPINPLRPYFDPEPITPERLQSYSLIGDPAMMWRHDVTGTGTPVSWLEAYGLTAWDGDVSDGDGDGWSAWQEYQAGTRPDTNHFQIATQTLDLSQGTLGFTFETEAHKRYRVLWKYALDDPAPWVPTSWALPEQMQTLRSPDEFIIPSSALMSICVPVRPGDTQGFFRIQQVE